MIVGPLSDNDGSQMVIHDNSNRIIHHKITTALNLHWLGIYLRLITLAGTWAHDVILWTEWLVVEVHAQAMLLYWTDWLIVDATQGAHAVGASVGHVDDIRRSSLQVQWYNFNHKGIVHWWVELVPPRCYGVIFVLMASLETVCEPQYVRRWWLIKNSRWKLHSIGLQ